MTFDFERVCALAGGDLHSGTASRGVGTKDALTLLAVLDGQCLAAGQPAGKGAVLAAAGTVTVETVGNCATAFIAISGEAAQSFAAGLDSPLCLPAGACPGAAEAIGRLAKQPPTPCEASALCYGLLCRLAVATAGEGPMPPLVAAALDELQTHYAEVYGVEELADELGVSKSHLIRAFTAAVGISPGRYLTGVRVENARRLLAGTTLPLDVVASLCGFSDGNYLCKVFKKETGLSPGDFRRMASPAPGRPVNEWEEQLYL